MHVEILISEIRNWDILLQTMGGIKESILTVILSVEFIIGTLGNGFIALVICVDWVRRRKISSADRILTALAISRIALLWLVWLAWWLSIFYPVLMRTAKMIWMVFIPLRIANHFSIWLATSLSIFYFLKIANFSNSIFLYLRWRVKKVISVVMLVSVFLLFLNIVLMSRCIDVWINRSVGNMSDSSSSRMFARFSKFLLLNNTMFTVIPFSISLATFLLLIFSLWRHLKTMQRSAPGCRDASTTAHVKALQTVVTFLLLYTIFILSFFIQVWSFDLVDKNPIISFVWATEMIFPSVHSYVLILGNSKLRQESALVLWWLRGRSKHAGPSDP